MLELRSSGVTTKHYSYANFPNRGATRHAFEGPRKVTESEFTCQRRDGLQISLTHLLHHTFDVLPILVVVVPGFPSSPKAP